MGCWGDGCDGDDVLGWEMGLEGVEEGSEEVEGCVVLRGSRAVFMIDCLRLVWLSNREYVESGEINHDELMWEELNVIEMFDERV